MAAQSLSSFLFDWVAVPFLAPFLPYMSSILGTYRLFQSLPQIPAAIFAVVVVASVYQLHKILGAIVAIACVLFLACTMAIHTLPHLDRLFDDYVEVSEHRILLETRALLEPYRTLFTKKDVIVAPENVALVIPALVQAHVINGHKGNTERFQERAWLVNAVYQSSLSETDFVQFLKDFHVTYVLWGYHAPPLVNSAYQPLGLWQEVKKKDPYSLVSINQSMKNLYLDK